MVLVHYRTVPYAAQCDNINIGETTSLYVLLPISMGDQIVYRPCPGVHGKCIEKIQRITKRAQCCGCERGYALVLEHTLKKRTDRKQVKDAIVAFKQDAYH